MLPQVLRGGFKGYVTIMMLLQHPFLLLVAMTMASCSVLDDQKYEAKDDVFWQDCV